MTNDTNATNATTTTTNDDDATMNKKRATFRTKRANNTPKHVTLVEIARAHNIDPKIARARFRKLYASDAKNLPPIIDRWTFDAKHRQRVEKILTKS